MKHATPILFLMILLLSLPAPVHAAEEDWYDYSPQISVPLTAFGLSVWIAGELLKDNLVPDEARWTATNPVDDAVRDTFRWNSAHTKDANMASNIVLGSIPVAGLASLLFSSASGWSSPNASRARQAGYGGLIMLESASVAMLANQVVKFLVLRKRPYTRDSSYGEMAADDHLSFYSGHTTTAFALAVSGAMLYDMKGGNHPGAVWTAALVLATGVGYLRIAADKHYFSDVLVGALLGAAAGYLVPKLLHQKDKEPTVNYSVMPLPSSDTWIFGVTFAL
ncbi:phosphatase PAP2 family protein [Myxococcota bacterium]|nr:phosphatase PAP2 family protein [Myxococcota bacterium]MBU1412386.1 phosphatase PAP2 family protein [Myxococcota bacterium]MBU1511422.1 phosphatase PAP2 family protein [Myxococcota bacterium]